MESSCLTTDFPQTQAVKVYSISRSVFNALSPLDQIAARALEKCGTLRIRDDDRRDITG